MSEFCVVVFCMTSAFYKSLRMTSGSLHQILKDWDGANFELRKNLLTQFCQLTAGKSAFDMTGQGTLNFTYPLPAQT